MEIVIGVWQTAIQWDTQQRNQHEIPCITEIPENLRHIAEIKKYI